jgi:hypothetical protein
VAGTGAGGAAGGGGTGGGALTGVAWIRQFGSSAVDQALSVTTDGSGNVVVSGNTFGVLPGQAKVATEDGFLRKYDAAGNETWTRQFGPMPSDGRLRAEAVAADGNGALLVGGNLYRALAGQTHAGGQDAFVRKHDAAGNELWSRQFGSSATEWGLGVAADAGGNVLIAGATTGTLSGQTSAGDTDAFVCKYDGSGNALWTRQFGTSLSDTADAVSVDSTGNVLVVGSTAGAFPGYTAAGGWDVFVCKYDGAGNALWARQFGSDSDDVPSSVSVDASGNVFVAGRTDGTLAGQTSRGGMDAFVRKYDGAGNELWTRQFGSSGSDAANGASVDGAGKVIVAGYTSGALPGQASLGSSDAFACAYDGAGNELWTRQLGSSAEDLGSSVHASAAGTIVVAGYTAGAFPGQISAGDRDGFVVKLGP